MYVLLPRPFQVMVLLQSLSFLSSARETPLGIRSRTQVFEFPQHNFSPNDVHVRKTRETNPSADIIAEASQQISVIATRDLETAAGGE